jgi:uroporphyrinogen-III synthase
VALRRELGRDFEIVISPLTRIEFFDGTPDLNGLTKLVFTSINGVRAYSQCSERRDIPCYTVGDATATYAELQGLRATSCQGNAQDLIARILADGERGPVLHIRGAHSRGKVAESLRNAGCEAAEIILYRQVKQELSEIAKRLLEAKTPVIVPLFSPRGAKQFVRQYHGCAPLSVVAMSSEVAKAAQAPVMWRVDIAKSPNQKAMLDVVKGLLVAD